MDVYGWVQLILFTGILLACTRPMGVYLVSVLDADGKTFLDTVARPLERLLYRLAGIDSKNEQTWKQYAISLCLFSLVSLLFTYAILRLQHLLPLNPQGF
ncbi:MAG: potassium-transporting ATPase subunit KdpA, partial [Proteobacteria bacterium]|nr:potassium-transporting ATPase subunit KdpA [Pseudomonadota bacterium]